MKKIGLIGGMSWESTQVYYKYINEYIREHVGGFHSSSCVIESVDFAQIEQLMKVDDWDSISEIIIKSAKNLEQVGAEALVICTNSIHLIAHQVQDSINIPLIHIAEETGKQIQMKGLGKVLLLGTRFTMERAFFKSILKSNFNIEAIIPNEADRYLVNQVIFNDLVHGHFLKKSKEQYLRIIDKSTHEGAEGVILGCTEIPLLIQAEEISLPSFDTTKIHSESAAHFSIH